MSTLHAAHPEAGPPTSPSDNAWSMACHLCTLTTFFFSLELNIPGILAPLILWQLLESEHPAVSYHAKEAFNFQLNVLAWLLVALLLDSCCLGVMKYAVIAGNALFTLVAATNAANGERYRYPWILRVLDPER